VDDGELSPRTLQKELHTRKKARKLTAAEVRAMIDSGRAVALRTRGQLALRHDRGMSYGEIAEQSHRRSLVDQNDQPRT
jgi:hypothetical protein